ncbi:RNA polymerase sigma factor [Agromyces sp. SYSU T00194]|uniref:RNA polymerase sigma factor n=1 Tax=Agromyces chitinivorans TaxID=3158560 RepID=UPI00339316A6
MAGGWQDAVADLVARRGPALTRFAVLVCGDEEDAADIVQEALARAWARPGRSVDPERAEAYVRRTIANAVIDQQRRGGRWRRIRHLVVQPDLREDDADAADRRIDLLRRLGDLPPRQRACLVLRYYEDRTVAEVADVLGIRPGSVKRYLSDGLDALFAALEPAAAAAGVRRADLRGATDATGSRAHGDDVGAVRRAGA